MNSPEGWTPDAHVEDEVLAALSLHGHSVEGSGRGGTGYVDVDAGVPTEGHRAHVDACPHCSEALAGLREVLVLVAAGSEDELVVPPAAVWESVLAGLEEDDRDAGESGESGEVSSRPQRPAEGRDPEADPDRGLAPVVALRERRMPVRLAAVAAAVALLAGVGVGGLLVWLVDDDAPAPVAQTLGDATLTTLDDAALPRGIAELRRQDDQVVLHVRAADLDGPDGDPVEGTHEVWLINEDGERMVSLGLLPSGASGDFPLPERLVEQGYRIVDISFEPDDGNPVHSGQSLARGTIEG